MKTQQELDRETAAVVCALGERDLCTAEHSDRVEALALELGKAVGLSSLELHQLAYVARLHDIGKIGIPDNVLLKPGRLDASEMQEMKTHPERGYKILLAIEDSDLGIAKGVLHHHETFDGLGYPHGLKGEDIPHASRIVALADCYDAMASDRPYHQGRSHEDIISIMFERSSAKFDPWLSGKFLSVIERSSYRALSD
ncbi:MAG: HD-GYP domain-containing protein [Moraxellaceae bacterium]